MGKTKKHQKRRVGLSSESDDSGEEVANVSAHSRNTSEPNLGGSEGTGQGKGSQAFGLSEITYSIGNEDSVAADKSRGSGSSSHQKSHTRSNQMTGKSQNDGAQTGESQVGGNSQQEDKAPQQPTNVLGLDFLMYAYDCVFPGHAKKIYLDVKRVIPHIIKTIGTVLNNHEALEQIIGPVRNKHEALEQIIGPRVTRDETKKFVLEAKMHQTYWGPGYQDSEEWEAFMEATVNLKMPDTGKKHYGHRSFVHFLNAQKLKQVTALFLYKLFLTENPADSQQFSKSFIDWLSDERKKLKFPGNEVFDQPRVYLTMDFHDEWPAAACDEIPNHVGHPAQPVRIADDDTGRVDAAVNDDLDVSSLIDESLPAIQKAYAHIIIERESVKTNLKQYKKLYYDNLEKRRVLDRRAAAFEDLIKTKTQLQNTLDKMGKIGNGSVRKAIPKVDRVLEVVADKVMTDKELYEFMKIGAQVAKLGEKEIKDLKVRLIERDNRITAGIKTPEDEIDFGNESESSSSSSSSSGSSDGSSSGSDSSSEEEDVQEKEVKEKGEHAANRPVEQPADKDHDMSDANDPQQKDKQDESLAEVVAKHFVGPPPPPGDASLIAPSESEEEKEEDGQGGESTLSADDGEDNCEAISDSEIQHRIVTEQAVQSILPTPQKQKSSVRHAEYDNLPPPKFPSQAVKAGTRPTPTHSSSSKKSRLENQATPVISSASKDGKRSKGPARNLFTPSDSVPEPTSSGKPSRSVAVTSNVADQAGAPVNVDKPPKTPGSSPNRANQRESVSMGRTENDPAINPIPRTPGRGSSMEHQNRSSQPLPHCNAGNTSTVPSGKRTISPAAEQESESEEKRHRRHHKRHKSSKDDETRRSGSQSSATRSHSGHHKSSGRSHDKK